MSSIGLYFGEEGYNVYKDMHHSSINISLHGLFMPFVVYGILWGLPVIWSSNGRQAHNYAVVVYLMYAVYYLSFDFWGGLLTAGFYAPAVIWFPNWKDTHQGGSIARICSIAFVMALAIQEFIGHWIFENTTSDFSIVPTSITIAPLFGVRALFGVA